MQPQAVTSSPQLALKLSKRIVNLSKPTAPHNANATIRLSAMEEKFIYETMNINVVLDPTTVDLLEIRQVLKTPEAEL